jgi:hypothetical protein
MPLIEVTEKQYEFLKNLQNEINTQDNRATAKPYFFQVKKTDRVYGESLCQSDGHGYVDKDESQFYDEIPDKEEAGYEDMGDSEYQDRFERTEYQEIVSYDNCFFTEKACLRHIKENKHHYADEEPMQLTYLNAAWRKPEMEMMFDIISSVKFMDEAKNES